MSIWDFILTRDPLLLVVTFILFLILLKSSIVRIPWIRWPKKKEVRIVTHSECPLYHDYLSMRRASMELAVAPYRLVRDQMTKWEDAEDEIKDLLFKRFLNFLEVNNVPGIEKHLIDHPEARDYVLVTKYALTRLKGKARFYFRENHLADMSDDEFREKKRERTTQIINLLFKEMNSNFPASMRTTRDEAFKHAQDIVPQLERIIYDTFEKARSMAFASQERMSNLEKEELLKEDSKELDLPLYI
jgi:hypothetical protein